MAMQFFYSTSIVSDFFSLNDEESAHCIRVLRKAVGDHLTVVDGHGTLCHCHIIEAHPRHCTVQVDERVDNYQPHPFFLHLAVAPTKNTARMEWMLEKAVEMGVDRITPLICDHSERCVLKQERLERIAVSAMKQSLKAFLPLIDRPTPIGNVIAAPFTGQRFIAYCDGDHRTPLRQAYTTGNDVQILIGPEGDFSPAEVESALASLFVPVTLGNCRLRTETAAIAATAFFNLA